VVLKRGEALRQPILAPDVELELIRAFKQDGDEAAIEAICRSYARLCYSIASLYTKDESRMEDLAQDGSFGVRRAVEMYDPSRGTKFSTYSRLWIKNFIAMGVSTALNDITVPARAFMDARMGRMEQGRNDSAVFASQPFVMIDAPWGEDGTGSVLDMHVREETTPEILLGREDMQRHMRSVIAGALGSLSEREADVIRRRKLQEVPDTLEEISDDYGVTRERIRQIEAVAMGKMKASLVESGFESKSFFQD
jgi:RNA polymerase sigma factor (sigma-70 family)